MLKDKGVILSVIMLFMILAYGCSSTGKVNGGIKPERQALESDGQHAKEGIKRSNVIKSIEVEDYLVNVTAEKAFDYSIMRTSDPFKVVAVLMAVERGAFLDRVVSTKEGIGDVALQNAPGTDGSLNVEITLTTPYEVTHSLAGNVLTIDARGRAEEVKSIDIVGAAIDKKEGTLKSSESVPDGSSSKPPKPDVKPVEKHATSTDNVSMNEAKQITGVSFKRERDAISVIIHGDGIMKPIISSVANVSTADNIAIDIPNVKIATKLPKEIAAPLKALRWEEGKMGVRIVLDLQKETPYEVLTVNDTIIVSLTTVDRIEAAMKRAVKNEDLTHRPDAKSTDARSNTKAEAAIKKKDSITDTSIAATKHGSEGTKNGAAKGESLATQIIDDKSLKIIKEEGEGNTEVYLCGKKLSCGTHNKIRINIQNAPVTALLKLLAEESGCDIVVDPDVAGTVTMQVKDAPWYQVVELIQKILKLGCDVTGNIIRVAQKKTLEDMRKSEIDAKKREDDEKLRIVDIKQQEEKAMLELSKVKRMDCILKFIPADEINKKIQSSHEQIYAARTGEEVAKKQAEKEFLTSFLSYRGMSYADEAENKLTVIDIEPALEKIENFIRALDVPKKQVLIEAKIIEVNSNMSDSLGINWGFFTKSFDRNTAIGVGKGTGVTGDTFLPNMPSTVSNLGSGIALGFINAQRTLGLDLKLQAMETSNSGRIITSPRLLTMNNELAKITQGQEIPYPVMNQQGVVSAAFKSVAVSIAITPKITPGKLINMDINITKEDLLGYTKIGGSDTPNTSKISELTKVLVKDGETLVLGGIFKQNTAVTEEGTAGLKDIPILGWLFKSASKANTESEYLIFITPRIVERSFSSEATECKIEGKSSN